MEKIKIKDALLSLRPGEEWVITNNDYSTLEWHSNTLPPTEEEINKEIERIKYKKQRELNYPSIKDQLDILYHQGYEGWKKNIKEVKDKYPKPEQLDG